jgi:hypothetical protein
MQPATGLAELTTLVRDCSVAGVQRRVLLLRIDLLPPRLSQPHHLRLAREALDPLVGADRARQHVLIHDRIAISWRGEAAARLNQVLEGLDHLLLDAPMAAPTMPEFARLFDLPKDGAAMLAVAGSASRATAADQGAPGQTTTEDHSAPVAAAPLDLAALDTIETRLAAANVARFARRRLVCRLDNGGFSPAWEARFLSVKELVEELCPGRDAFAEPWLIRRLTRLLDRRMLALLSSPPELREAGPFALDLNISGILSQEFLRFDHGLPSRLRGQTVLNLDPADVMGDLSTFRFASTFARARGHRIMLRNVTPPLLSLLNLGALDLDFAELHWSPSLQGFDPAGLRAGSARWVLARADEMDAVRWGRAAGIGLFQGKEVRAGAGLGLLRSAA